MPVILDTEKFISSSLANIPVIDVRSPKEFEQGHIPGAINIPLFNNEERAEVGTIYKQKGKQEAIQRGLQIVGPKMADMSARAIKLAVNNAIFVHCWRGGMRSGSVAWLFEMCGLKVSTLKGGYKAYRKFAFHIFTKDYPFIVLGGKTGSGKTRILNELDKAGETIIDLEKIAHHKGSAFGSLGEKQQPTQEQFENELAWQLFQVQAKQRIWIEDEGRLIGTKVIPENIWNQMRSLKLYHLNLPFEIRVNNLIEEYGRYPANELETAIIKITRRLGPQQTKECLEALHSGDLRTTCSMCLHYYDKTYLHGLLKRDKNNVAEIDFTSDDMATITQTLIQKVLKDGTV